MAKIPKEHAEAFGLPPKEFDALIVIEPDEGCYSLTGEQTGQLKVTLPGDKEQTKSLAFWLAGYAVQHITFSQGKMSILYEAITGEHLPDTPEESKQLVDGPFFTKLT